MCHYAIHVVKAPLTIGRGNRKRVYTHKNLLQLLKYIFSIIIYAISYPFLEVSSMLSLKSGGYVVPPRKKVGVWHVLAFPFDLSIAPRSHDMDFLLWGYVKDYVYQILVTFRGWIFEAGKIVDVNML